MSRIKSRAPALHKYKLSRGVPGACPGVSRGGPRDRVPGCPGVVCPGFVPGRDAFSSYWPWGFIPGDLLALHVLGSGFCLGSALAYRGSIPTGAAVTCHALAPDIGLLGLHSLHFGLLGLHSYAIGIAEANRKATEKEQNKKNRLQQEETEQRRKQVSWTVGKVGIWGWP